MNNFKNLFHGGADDKSEKTSVGPMGPLWQRKRLKEKHLEQM